MESSTGAPAGGSKEDRPPVVILGKIPPPFMGPAIATSIILRSRLNDHFALHHVDTRAHESLQSLGEWSASKILRNLTAYAKAARVFRTVRPALTLIPFSQSTTGFAKDSVFILTAALLGRRVVLQLRGGNLKNWLAESNWLVRQYVRAVIRTTEGAIVLGDNLREMFDGLLPEDRVFVVPNGADYEFPAPKMPRAENAIRFLYIANLRESKGVVDLVRAISVLKNRGVGGFMLDVVGEWRDEKAEAACTELTQREALPITFHGAKYDADKLAFYSNADVLVFVPREPEGHPWVVVEALAAGLPVIATDRGAIRESVHDGVNGFLLTDGCPTDIADAMQRFIANRETIRPMGNASQSHYTENFTELRMVERLRTVFDALIEAR